MSGIYIHIPFCKHKCAYCNFFSIASRKGLDDFANFIIREIELQKNYLEEEKVETIYFGGGTPSMLEISGISRVLDKIYSVFEVNENPEITLEANPDDLTSEYLNQLKNTQINRLSIGIQSFFDEDLNYLGRIHNSSQAENCLKAALNAGFSNLSADLIYGIPTLSDENLIKNLEKFTNLQIPHISAYALTVEPKTPLDQWINKGKRMPVDEEKAANQFNLVMHFLEQNGYLQYEISNYCKAGLFAKHNTNYWKGVKYLGLGPSAHSFNGKSRQWNIAGILKYTKGIENGQMDFEKEILSQNQQFNEYIMTSLRTVWGCDTGFVREQFGENFYQKLLTESGKFLQNEMMKEENGFLKLTSTGKMHADGIASHLFEVDF